MELSTLLTRAGTFAWTGRPTVGPVQLPRIPTLVGMTALLLLIAVDIRLWWFFVFSQQGPIDFHVYWLAGRLATSQGWAAPYDVARFMRTLADGGFAPMPYAYPPPMTLLVAPLAALPFWVAFTIWEALLLGCIVASWSAVTAGPTIRKLPYLLAIFAVFPTTTVMRQGQVDGLIAGLLVASWWLLRSGRPVQAGLVLSLCAIKPQLVLLVPVALLFWGEYRAFTAWCGGTVALILVSIALLGGTGLTAFRGAIHYINNWYPAGAEPVSVLAKYGWVPYLVMTAAVVVVVIVVCRNDEQREAGMAAALVGSLMITPYLRPYDAMLGFVAAWFLVRSDPRFPAALLFFLGVPVMEVLNGDVPWWTLWCAAILVYVLARLLYRRRSVAVVA